MPTYTQPSDLNTLDPHTLAADLRTLVAAGDRFFTSISAEAAAAPLAPGKWSIQQTVGHLIDSAANNAQRIVRLQLVPEIALPGYEQDGWVSVQCYELESWEEIRTLWLALNRHLAHIIEHADRNTFPHLWHFETEDVSLGFIIEDYIAHMRYHLVRLPGFTG